MHSSNSKMQLMKSIKIKRANLSAPTWMLSSDRTEQSATKKRRITLSVLKIWKLLKNCQMNRMLKYCMNLVLHSLQLKNIKSALKNWNHHLKYSPKINLTSLIFTITSDSLTAAKRSSRNLYSHTPSVLKVSPVTWNTFTREPRHTRWLRCTQKLSRTSM